jgi:hypothetical protein
MDGVKFFIVATIISLKLAFIGFVCYLAYVLVTALAKYLGA